MPTEADMAFSWKSLEVSRSTKAHLPPLLISGTFGPDSYDIHITDLTNIWSESLDRGGIIRRSQEESSSIDPSDGDQMRIFLDKIKLGVEGGKSTTSALTIEAGLGRPGIAFDIRVDLPGGLAPLEWTLHLSAEPHALLTNEFTIPLLESQHQLIQEVAGLEEALILKDHVIQKLLDKFEEQGTQLGQIFPQVASKGGRTMGREKAMEKVKGLGTFNIETWRNSLTFETSRDTTNLIESVFGRRKTKSPKSKTGPRAPNRTSEWWEVLKGDTIHLSTGKSEISVASRAKNNEDPSKPVAKTEDSMQEEDDFQVQDTPPHLLPLSSKQATFKYNDDESTNNDQGFNGTSKSSTIPDDLRLPSPAALPQKKKLGMLGGKSQAHKATSHIDEDETEDESPAPDRSPERPYSPIPEQMPKRKGKLGTVGGKKEPLPSPRESTPQPKKPKKSKLGKIGGKKKEPTPPPSYVSAYSTPESPIPPPKTEAITNKKLGTFGGRDKTPAKGSSSPPKDMLPRGRSTKVEKEETPPPRETSEERADKRRLQLKRELEAKAKAPVKKKRKF